jgi:hypothetical protein
MSKPIFIMRFPDHDEIDIQTFEKHYENIGNQLNDYHVLAVIDSYVRTITFECFNAPHTEMEFEELKKRVLELIKEKKNE